MSRIFEFEELANARLIVDAIYKGGTTGNASDEPLTKIFNVGVSGGFRKSGTVNPWAMNYVLLTSSMSDLDWPDYLDLRNGLFFYFGDNKTPGNDLHDTHHKGNLILKTCFDKLSEDDLENIPPFFIFTKGDEGRDTVFRGLAVPGALAYESTDNLIAVWKTSGTTRYQNYKAVFTILDINEVKREWISDLENGDRFTSNTPRVYSDWVKKKLYKPLISEKSIEYRTKDQQIPQNDSDMRLRKIIYDYFNSGINDEYDFERCAAEIIKLMDKNVISIDVTRRSVDGGRDGIGKYSIGSSENAIEVEFAMEAKLWKIERGVGVKETSRLISRIRHRQFGILVTTSFVSQQAYKEITDDGHPIIIISAVDILKILKQNGITGVRKLNSWLNQF